MQLTLEENDPFHLLCVFLTTGVPALKVLREKEGHRARTQIKVRIRSARTSFNTDCLADLWECRRENGICPKAGR